MTGFRFTRYVAIFALLLSVAIVGSVTAADLPKLSGGLVVQLGCDDAASLVKLKTAPGIRVHGLDMDRTQVDAARQAAQKAGVQGEVSAALFDGRTLPYVDNLVSVLVVNKPYDVSREEMLRVLSPGGKLILSNKKGNQETLVKTKPEDTDDWTHYLGDATNNAVAHDEEIGPPMHYQWTAAPRWARAHEQFASVSAVVEADGRIYTIADFGPIASIGLPPDWRLVARDAHNGLLLWEKPIGPWEGHMRGFRSGPAEISRRLVADDGLCFATLGYGQPVTAIDGATGKIVRTFDQTEGASEMIYDGGKLYVVVGERDEQSADAARRRGAVPQIKNLKIVAIDAKSGRTLWTLDDASTAQLLPLSLTTDGDAVVYQNPAELVCLDAASGKERWTIAQPASIKRKAWATSTVVLYDDVVICADQSGKATDPAADIDWVVSIGGGGGKTMVNAYSLETGERLWSAAGTEGYNAPTDVFVIDDIVWMGTTGSRRGPDFTQGRDLHTGEVLKKIDTAKAFGNAGMPHHRCYRNKATSNYIVIGRAGTEMVELDSGTNTRHHWIRGTCQYGVMPAAGLLYVPQNSCACFIKGKLAGFNALSARQTEVSPSSLPRLEEGPAIELAGKLASGIDRPIAPEDWPTYRRDAMRSGVTRSTAPAEPKLDWALDLGGQLTAMTYAGGKLYVAAKDRHTVYAIDARTGKTIWSFAAGGRIDSPPTIYNNLVIFGSADGSVYCLSSDDGQLAWRLRAAPDDRRMIAYDQLESVWPVSGSVLIKDGEIWCVAGRTSYLDGGMWMTRIDPATGQLISQTPISHRDPETGDQPDKTIRGFDIDGALPDVLSCIDGDVFMRHLKFDAEGNLLPDSDDTVHLFTPTGFLDDTWWHRTYWLWGDHFIGGWAGWWKVGGSVPSGRIMSIGEEAIYGFGRNKYPGGNSGQLSGERYQLFAADRDASKTTYRWQQRADLEVHAMAVAADRLVIAGPPADARESIESFRGDNGAKLETVDARTGETIATVELDNLPVFDGLIVADGKIFLTDQAGRIMCFGGK